MASTNLRNGDIILDNGHGVYSDSEMIESMLSYIADYDPAYVATAEADLAEFANSGAYEQIDMMIYEVMDRLNTHLTNDPDMPSGIYVEFHPDLPGTIIVSIADY